MPAIPVSDPVGVIGAGTMGSGIAQVAAAAGHPVLLFDTADGAAAKGIQSIGKALERVVAKGRMEEHDRQALLDRITPCATFEDLRPAKFVIEVVVENLEVKRQVFGQLDDLFDADVILASNTSSISITAMGRDLKHPERLVGAHFFNPAPLMALVEVISGLATDKAAAETVFATMEAWGKSPVDCISTPGFVVNRVARPYYIEAQRVLSEGAADPATIDAVQREAGGFRMGPFELMDLIGNDINYTVTCALFEAFGSEQRYAPPLPQQDLMDAGRLGRKTGHGFYDHAEGAEKPAPHTAEPGPKPANVRIDGGLGIADSLVARITDAGIPCENNPGSEKHGGRIVIDGATLCLTDGRSATQRAAEEGLDDLVVFDLALDFGVASRVAIAAADQAGAPAAAAAAGLFQALGMAVSVIDDIPAMTVMRAVCMLANVAADAVHFGVTDAIGVDLAMMKGVNYPRGPLEWADDIGPAQILAVIDNMAAAYGEDRYRASPLLRRKVWAGGRFRG